MFLFQLPRFLIKRERWDSKPPHDTTDFHHLPEGLLQHADTKRFKLIPNFEQIREKWTKSPGHIFLQKEN